MKITFLSDKNSWKNPEINILIKKLRKKGHRAVLVHCTEEILPGDLLFILGFFKIVSANVLSKNKNNLVVHESQLPKGRGWSPMTWLIVGGAKTIPLTLFEAVERVDAGKIYLRGLVKLKGNEILTEMREKITAEMMSLCEKFIDQYPAILKKGFEQRGKPTYYPKRTTESSRLDPNKSIASQFNLLRVVDNQLYPAHFTYKGASFILKIEKKDN